VRVAEAVFDSGWDRKLPKWAGQREVSECKDRKKAPFPGRREHIQALSRRNHRRIYASASFWVGKLAICS
jgi:hypothetical protein